MKVIRHRPWQVVGVLVSIIVLQMLIAASTIEVLSAVRAYVAGESLYSKGQKDALLRMRAYLQFHQEMDYRLFLSSLAVPEGDARARLALQQPIPDRRAAREGFLAGQNDEEDVDGLIRLFVWGQHLPFMARAIGTWSAADGAIAELHRLVDEAHARIEQGRPDAPEVLRLMALSSSVNARLSGLERAFSDELGRASRRVQFLLLGLNLLIGIGLSILGAMHLRATLKAQRRSDAEVAELERQLLASRNLELTRLAFTDSLTGLPNRDALESHLQEAVAQGNRGGASFGVMFLDLDGFKKVNDAHGHLAGDRLLKEAATRLRRAVRREDEVFRISGDEFVVIMRGDPSAVTCEALASRVLAAIREPYDLDEARAHVTASIGVARHPEHGADARALLLAADAAMYRAKQAGRDCAAGID